MQVVGNVPHTLPEGLPPQLTLLLEDCMKYDTFERPWAGEVMDRLQAILVVQQVGSQADCSLLLPVGSKPFYWNVRRLLLYHFEDMSLNGSS